MAQKQTGDLGVSWPLTKKKYMFLGVNLVKVACFGIANDPKVLTIRPMIGLQGLIAMEENLHPGANLTLDRGSSLALVPISPSFSPGF